MLLLRKQQVLHSLCWLLLLLTMATLLTMPLVIDRLSPPNG
jgi:hypothetical protein